MAARVEGEVGEGGAAEAEAEAEGGASAAGDAVPPQPPVPGAREKQRRNRPLADVVFVESMAGLSTTVMVQLGKLRVCFDMGKFDRTLCNARHVFLSHGHTDHCGAMFLHARGANLMRKEPEYHMPAECVEPAEQALNGFSVMNGEPIRCTMTAAAPGDRFEVARNTWVTVFETEHRVPAQGYQLWQRSRCGLKEEYAELERDEIIALRKQKVEVEDYDEVLECVYTGDTLFSALLNHEEVFSARVLIMELTYIDEGTTESARQWGHIHLNDVVEHADMFRNEHIVFMHISSRYTIPQIRRIIQNALPDALRERCSACLKAFGAREYLSSLADGGSSSHYNHQRGSRGGGWGRGGGGRGGTRRSGGGGGGGHGGGHGHGGGSGGGRRSGGRGSTDGGGGRGPPAGSWAAIAQSSR